MKKGSIINTLSRPSKYEGRSGETKLMGIAVTLLADTDVRINPVNAAGIAVNTWMDIPKEDAPALVASLQQVVEDGSSHSGYEVFLMLEAARIFGTIPKDLEYDTSWDMAKSLLEAFKASEHDDPSIPQWEAMESFLRGQGFKEVKAKRHYYAFGSDLVRALDMGDEDEQKTAEGGLFVFEEGVTTPSELLDAQDGWNATMYLNGFMTEEEFNELKKARS